MGNRFKFECSCGQHLVAEPRLAGYRIRCPVCLQELLVPAAGNGVDEAGYRKAERYVLVCSCKYRMLVKAGAAGHMLHCPLCQAKIKVPTLDVLRRGTTRVMVMKPTTREKVRTEELLLVVDDDEGPGPDVR